MGATLLQGLFNVVDTFWVGRGLGPAALAGVSTAGFTVWMMLSMAELSAVGLTAVASRRQAERESAAIIAFTSAIAAYGAFFIPKLYGTSIAMTGAPNGALWAFLGFYVICLIVTWVYYTRPGGLLHDIERGRGTDAAAQPAE